MDDIEGKGKMKPLDTLIVVGIVIGLLCFIFFSMRGEESYTTAEIFLLIAVILIMAKISSLVERFGQPAVLGELILGVILGNLFLLGITIFEPLRDNPIIAFLSEIGIIILLFQVGLVSNVDQMKKVGTRAFLVACVGVVAPLLLAVYVVGPLLLPQASFQTYLFLGATLTATSVGITARVFKDLDSLHIPEAQIVLGAAVIDDVLGLIILAVVSAMITIGAVSIGAITLIVGKSILFLIGSIFVGQLIAPKLGRFLSKIHDGIGMKFTFAIAFCLVFAFLAEEIGLAPIVGAFAAGLMLDPVHFFNFQSPQIITDLKKITLGKIDEATKKKIVDVVNFHNERHIEDLIEPLSYFFVPIFFVMTGFAVKIETFLNPSIVLLAIGIVIAAFVSKIISGLAAGRVDKKIVGVGMIPRGEVGLIFAIMGKGLGVMTDDLFSAVVVVIILTTLLTPPVLAYLIKKKNRSNAMAEEQKISPL